jgi:hypothetical protein
MATAICEHKGVLLVDHGNTVTAGHCCAKCERLHWDICCKRVEVLHQDIIILHDNARPRVTNNTCDWLWHQCWGLQITLPTVAILHPVISICLKP